MIWYENGINDGDCNFSDLPKAFHGNENRSVSHLGRMNYQNFIERPGKLCVNQLQDSDYEIPQQSFRESLGSRFPKDSSTLQGYYGDHAVSMTSCSPEQTNVSVYENLAQNRTEINTFTTDTRDMSSDSGVSSKSEEAKSKMIGMYIVEKTIGKGNFSVVKFATHKLTQVKVAIKIIDKTRLSAENLQKIHREVEIMKLLHHPHIVKLYQVMESDTMIYIVMEFVPNGEIFDYIANRGRFKEEEARQIFFQIVCAIEYCHARHIVHRDLKAENLLLDEQMNIKLADFGFGNFWQEDLCLSTFCGSPPYAAPEIFKGEKYSGPKADIWSLGVVLYVLVSGSLPFEERTLALLKERVVHAKYRIPFWMSDDCEDLIKNMLCRTPDRRFTIRQILDHRWMRRSGDLGRCAPNPCLADDMRKGIFNEQIISAMQQKGMSRKQIIESLSTCAYDHRTALYLLLGEKMRRRARGSMPEDNIAAPPASMMQRRPSSVAESLMLNRGSSPRDFQSLLSQYQQQQQQPQQPQLSANSFLGNVIDAMQTNVPVSPIHSTQQQQQQTSKSSVPCHHQLSAQLQNMAISSYDNQPRQQLTLGLDSSPIQRPSVHHCYQQHHQQHHRRSPPGFVYHNHHHQFDNGGCCLSSSASASASASGSPTTRHTPPGRQLPHSSHLRHSPAALAPLPLHHHHLHHHHHGHMHHHHHHLALPGQQSPQQHLHPSWAPSSHPRAAAIGPVRPHGGLTAICSGAPGPAAPEVAINVSSGVDGGGHRFNEGRRASDVGVIGALTPVSMEAQFAPLRAAARAGGVLDLVPTSEEDELPPTDEDGGSDTDEDNLDPMEPQVISGLETVEFVHASQLPSSPSPSPLAYSPYARMVPRCHVSVSPQRRQKLRSEATGQASTIFQQQYHPGKRFSLPVACAHAPMDEGDEALVSNAVLDSDNSVGSGSGGGGSS